MGKRFVLLGLLVAVLAFNSAAQWTRPVGSGSWSSTPIQMFTLYGDVNVTNATWSEWFCLANDCISAWPAGGAGADGNNYTSSMSVNNTGATYQINTARVGMSNLTAQFTITGLTDTNCSVDNSCPLIVYNSELSGFGYITNLTMNNTCNWNIDIINMPGDFSDGVDNEGNNWYATSGYCTNDTGSHECQISGVGITPFNFSFNDQTAGAGSDGNNYTSSIGFNNSGGTYQLNMQRVGMTNLSASFTIDGNDNWDNTYNFLTNSTMNHSVYCSNIDGEASNLCTLTDTNANTICAGTTTYLDGEGNCDDISLVYWDECSDAYACGWEDWDEDADVPVDGISESKIDMNTVCPSTSKLYVNGNDFACNADLDTYNTSDQMITAVNSSSGYFSNMKNNWNNLQNVPAGFADGTDDTGSFVYSTYFNQNLNTSNNVTFERISTYAPDGFMTLRGPNISFYNGTGTYRTMLGYNEPYTRIETTYSFYGMSNILSANDIYTTGTGDDLWLGASSQASASFRAYADGQLVAANATMDNITLATKIKLGTMFILYNSTTGAIEIG